MSDNLDPRQNAAWLKEELVQIANRLHPNKSAAKDLRYCETLLARVVVGFEAEIAALKSEVDLARNYNEF